MTRTQTDILSELCILEAQLGDHRAMHQLVEIWNPSLRARALRLTRHEDGTNEVVQETWIGIARGLKNLRDPSRFGPWAIRIVHHKASDWISQRVNMRESNETHRTQVVHLNPTDQSERLSEQHAQHIRNAISQLDPSLRDVVYLFYMDNCTIEQIALALTIPIGTTKTRLKRARDQLKPILNLSLERSTQ